MTRSAERHVPQCSAHAAASEYCWLQLHGTQHCSRPAKTVSGDSESQFSHQNMADVLDGLDVIAARSGHRCRMPIEQQTTVQHDSEDLHRVSHWQIDSSDSHGRQGCGGNLQLVGFVDDQCL